MQEAPADVRREFVRNPRTYMREALREDYDETVIENLFVETAAYSDRVQKIGLWQPKVLPWVVLPRQPWLPPERYGIFVSGNRIELQREEVDSLIAQIQTAMEQGRVSIRLRDQEIPATDNTLGALREIAARVDPATPIPDKEETEKEPNSSQPDAKLPPEGKNVLLIEDNLETLGFEAPFERREPILGSGLPSALKTEPKPHQRDGIEWLRGNWHAGRPGVLLADDMGLGKTLQALVFLAGIKGAMREGLVRRAPILIVAPSGLLSNWEKEHALHLSFPGLGRLLRAYGLDLAALRSKTGREIGLAAPVLEYEKLVDADWVLTTYETLRDYQHSFGKIPFSAIVFDEVQKTKTPGTLVTEAAKAMKAEFVLTMTGTPIENRLADLWCIADTAQPGLLGDLKTFSSRFEQNRDPTELAPLKQRLECSTPSRPAVMLRRLKADHLPGLSEKIEYVLERRMPEIQAEYYRKAVQEARADRSRGKLLQVLQRLRILSLHPLPPGAAADDQYIAASARYSEMFQVLDHIHKAGEKALIFLEFLELQAYLATLLQRRYRMESPPLQINGAVSGRKRQERVDRFQAGLPGFEVILLSPRAGGVGITLTAANHVIHLSRWWNPAVEDQCTDRVYRIGQTKPVHVYYPSAVFPDDEEHSFDRRLHALLTEKRSLSRDLLVPPAATDEDAQRLYAETIG
jgi:SNF2 family DNA or RNA helicase